jgi:hypothetical protein
MTRTITRQRVLPAATTLEVAFWAAIVLVLTDPVRLLPGSTRGLLLTALYIACGRCVGRGASMRGGWPPYCVWWWPSPRRKAT